MFRQLAPLSVLIFGAGFAASAWAKDPASSLKIINAAEGSSEIVIYGDLDITSASGAKILLKRIRSAADKLCGSYRPGDLWGRADHYKCVRTTIGETVAALNSPPLTALNERENT